MPHYPPLLTRLAESVKSTRRTKNEYIIDETFFNVIDTEEKAYFLGLLMADGNVSTSNGRAWHMSISIDSNDAYLLKRLRDLLNPTKTVQLKRIPPPNARCVEQTRLCVHSNRLVYSLIRLGCIPNKSLTLKPPAPGLIVDHLYHHFIRGYFDGDGGWIKLGYVGRIGGKITSATTFIKPLSRWLDENNIRHSVLTAGRPETSKATFTFYPCLLFYSLLYKDATIWMTRKRLQFEQTCDDIVRELMTHTIHARIARRHRYSQPRYELKYQFDARLYYGGDFKTYQEAVDYFNNAVATFDGKIDKDRNSKLAQIIQYVPSARNTAQSLRLTVKGVTHPPLIRRRTPYQLEPSQQ